MAPEVPAEAGHIVVTPPSEIAPKPMMTSPSSLTSKSMAQAIHQVPGLTMPMPWEPECHGESVPDTIAQNGLQ